jgi:hypothetical protein
VLAWEIKDLSLKSTCSSCVEINKMDPAAAATAPRGAFPAAVQPISMWALINTVLAIMPTPAAAT